jgi:uncharacterized protein YndB with AHSA1/START domain
VASTVITPNQDALVSEIHIAAPAARIFQALVDSSQVLQWWTGDDCQIESFSIEPREGGRWTYDTKLTKLNINGISKFHCEGEVLEYDPPRLLVYTWLANWHDDMNQRTIVRWELTSTKTGTHVKITHSGLASMPVVRKDYAGGWPGVIEMLKTFVEK